MIIAQAMTKGLLVSGLSFLMCILIIILVETVKYETGSKASFLNHPFIISFCLSALSFTVSTIHFMSNHGAGQ